MVSAAFFLIMFVKSKSEFFAEKTFVQMLFIIACAVVPTALAAFLSTPIASAFGEQALLTKIIYCAILTLIITIPYALVLYLLRSKIACLEKGGNING